MKCKRAECWNETIEPWWYCSKKCAPLGLLGGSRDTKSDKKMDLSSFKGNGAASDLSKSSELGGEKNIYPKKVMTYSEIMSAKNKGITTMQEEKSILKTGEPDGETSQSGEGEKRISKELSSTVEKTQPQDSLTPFEILEQDRLQSMSLISRSINQLSALMSSVRDETEQTKRIDHNLINSAANCAGQIQKLLRLKIDFHKMNRYY